MNYTLLLVVVGNAAGLIVMERWASWRLSVARRGPKQPAVKSRLLDGPIGIAGDMIAG